MSNPSEEVMKLAREQAASFVRWLDHGNSIGFLSAHAADGLSDSIAHAIMADRVSCQARVEELTEALRDAFCPRPCNGRPDHFEVGQCVDADECGCSLGHPLLTPAMLAARSTLERK